MASLHTHPTMFSPEITGIYNFSDFPSSNNPSFPTSCTTFLNTNFPTFQDFSPQNTSCISNNSTSDEADEYHLQQQSIIDERKQRRMISNRESARRSRMRKQRQMDELWSQVIRLRNENNNLIEKMNQISVKHENVFHENKKLKEEACDLRKMLDDIQLECSFDELKDLDNFSCNTEHFRAKLSSNQTTNSTELY